MLVEKKYSNCYITVFIGIEIIFFIQILIPLANNVFPKNRVYIGIAHIKVFRNRLNTLIIGHTKNI